MKIKIDDREDNGRKRSIMNAYPNISTVERLDVGDIIIERPDKPDIAIEIKTIPDFISSLKNRRLDKELISMHEVYPYSYCIVYGDWAREYYKYNRATIGQKYSAIIRASVRVGVPVYYGATTKHLLVIIDQLIKHVSSANDPIDMPVIRKKDKNIPVNVLIGIPHLGEQTALRLLDSFGTPDKVLSASREELESLRPRIRRDVVDTILDMQMKEN